MLTDETEMKDAKEFLRCHKRFQFSIRRKSIKSKAVENSVSHFGQ